MRVVENKRFTHARPPVKRATPETSRVAVGLRALVARVARSLARPVVVVRPWERCVRASASEPPAKKRNEIKRIVAK